MKKFITFKDYSDGGDVVVSVDKITCCFEDSGSSGDECVIEVGEGYPAGRIFKINQSTYDRIKQELLSIEEEKVIPKKISSAISELEV